MIFGLFTLLVALIIEAVGAYYSVTGLAAIFSGAVVPIIIMGGALEVGKVTAAVWLKMNWERASYAYKLYLVPAVAFLMVLTSMGIFGFLSKAHSDQSLVSGDSMAKVAIYDEKIKTSKDNIEANRKALKQMDDAVDQVMGRSTTEQGADKAVQIRRSQQKERARLQADIAKEQTVISKLNEESAPIRAEFRKIENEVGPIKYIAALVYGDNADVGVLEKAVRLVIIIIVAVFDPLALVLILAAQQSIRWARGGPVEGKREEEEPKVEPVTGNAEVDPLTQEEIEAQEKQDLENFFWRGKMIAKALDAEEAERTAKEANELLAEIVPEEPEVDIPEFSETTEVDPTVLAAIEAEVSRLTANAEVAQKQVVTLTSHLETMRNELAEKKTAYDELLVVSQQVSQQNQALIESLGSNESQVEILSRQNSTLNADVVTASETIARLNKWTDQLQADLRAAISLAHDRNEQLNALQQKLDALTPVQPEPEPETVEVKIEHVEEPEFVSPNAPDLDASIERPGDYLTPAEVEDVTYFDPHLGYEQRYFGNKYSTGAAPVAEQDHADFGTEFPQSPNKGDLFLRVDQVPNRLYKWNDSKWIEIDRSTNDRMAYNQAYIQYLVDKINNGEYDVDDLNDTERTEIANFLRNQNGRVQ